MKNFILILWLYIVCTAEVLPQPPVSGVSGTICLDSKAPVVKMLIPDGGENYGFSDPLNVHFTAADDTFGISPVSIGLSMGNGSPITIYADHLSNTGLYVLNPPSLLENYAKTWIVASDAFGNESMDGSDDFFSFSNFYTGHSGMITLDSKPPEISVISPNGGEEHYYADSLPVHWAAYDDSFGPAPLSVSLSTDGGLNYTLLAPDLADMDSVRVMPPEVICSLAKIKVSATDLFGISGSDESDQVFSLTGGLVDLKAFLEGPYQSSSMFPYLNVFGYLPFTQPYSGTPWNYNGTESVSSIPGNGVVDWVLVELRDAPSAAQATSATIKARKAAFIMQDGYIRDIDGSGLLQFGNRIEHNLFAVIWHRNHLGIMSSVPLVPNGLQYDYDFTTSSSLIYGGSLGAKQLEPGVWGMITGDGDADRQVTNVDKMNVWKPQTGLSGYRAGDFTLNGQVDNIDKARWKPNVGKSAQLP